MNNLKSELDKRFYHTFDVDNNGNVHFYEGYDSSLFTKYFNGLDVYNISNGQILQEMKSIADKSHKYNLQQIKYFQDNYG